MAAAPKPAVTRRRLQARSLIAAVPLLLTMVSATTVLATAGGAAVPQRPTLAKEAPATANVLSPLFRTEAEGDAPPQRPRMQNSPTLAVDPTDSRFVALANRLDGPDFSCDLQLSGNGGEGWVPARPVPTLPAGAEKCYAPEVAFDQGGTLYYLFVGLHTGGNVPMGVFLTTSADRGRSFAAPRQILGPIAFQVRMAIDAGLGEAGRLHLVWLQASSDPPLGGLPSPPNPIMAAYSDDGGRSFSAPTQVNDAAHQLAVAPALVIGADHAVHVLYYDLGEDHDGRRSPCPPPTVGPESCCRTCARAGPRTDPGTAPPTVRSASDVPMPPREA